MLATAPIAATPVASHPAPAVAPQLRTQLTVTGTVCSTPTLHWACTGIPVAHFRLVCEIGDRTDPRLRALADRDTGIIDVTVWGTDALLAAGDPNDMNPARFRVIMESRTGVKHRGYWSIDDNWVRQVRRGARITVEGTPRAGHWRPARHPAALPFGLMTELLPRGAAAR